MGKQLLLHENNLSGPVPAGFAKMTHLEDLRIKPGNNFQERQPDSFVFAKRPDGKAETLQHEKVHQHVMQRMAAESKMSATAAAKQRRKSTIRVNSVKAGL